MPADSNPADAVVDAFDSWKAGRPDLDAVDLALAVDDCDVSLESLECARPGLGLARECMRKLMDLADEHSVTLKGAVWSRLGEGTPEERLATLKAWYARCGFDVDFDPALCSKCHKISTCAFPIS